MNVNHWLLKSVLIPLAWIVAGIYAFLLIFVVLFQSSLMYFPTQRDQERLGRPPFVPWSDPSGEFLGYVRSSAYTQRVVIFFHGNAGEALDRAWVSELVPGSDVALVLAEYPGYGGKTGKPSEQAFIAAGRHLLAATRQRWDVPITLVGESIGTGVATALAVEQGIDRLALIAPFNSAEALARQKFPFLPIRLLMRDKYRSDRHLEGLTLPLHIIHGSEDDIIPIELARALYDQYTGAPKSFTTLPGAAHNDLVPALLNSPDARAFRHFLRQN